MKKLNVNKKLLSVVFILLLSMIAVFVTGCGSKKVNSDTKEKATQAASAATDTPTYEAIEETELKFRYEDRLTEHFQKQGSEFGYKTAEEYLAGANRVIASPDALHKKEAEDGDDVYYLEATNEIVFVSGDGYIRTYFKPSSGIDYYNRQ